MNYIIMCDVRERVHKHHIEQRKQETKEYIWGKRELGSYCLVNEEFQICEVKRDLEMASGDGRMAL